MANHGGVKQAVVRGLVCGGRDESVRQEGDGAGPRDQAEKLGQHLESHGEPLGDFILFFKIFIFFFWPPRVACGILVSRPGIEPGPPAMEGQSPNYWTTGEAPGCSTWWRPSVCFGRLCGK